MAATTEASRPVLIVNADDFGLTEAINRGIVEAFEAGALRSTSLMVSTPGFDDAVQLARAAGPHLGVGLHLVLTAGRPLTRAATLVDAATGEFFSHARLTFRALAGRVNPADVEAECAAQLARCRTAGIRVTHLDGHHHAHALPGVWPAVWRTALSAGVKVVRRPIEPMFGAPFPSRRLVARAALAVLARGAPASEPPRAVARFAGHSLLGANNVEAGLVTVIERLRPGVTELMVHPGYVSGQLPGNDAYRGGRERELRALTGPTVLRMIRHTVRLTHFGEI